MSKLIVLGAGMVGSAMAIDLAKRHQVSLTDIDPAKLDKAQQKCPELTTGILDVTQKHDLQNTVREFDLIVGAVPGHLGFHTVKACIEAGMDIVDISFFPENSLKLDKLAKENNVTAIVDCGVAPGIHNLILGYHDQHLKIRRFECMVGGLPKQKKWPFNYKAPFSSIDVIEEYTRPARFVEDGELIIREALTDCELIDFDHVGTLEAFNSDGLRTLIHTLPHIPNMKEKTLRYPGHVEYIRVLKESGFFSTNPLTFRKQEIIPLEFSCEVLFRDWKLGEDEEEFTLMQVKIEGENPEGKIVEVIYKLYDEYDHETHTSSMARTTGYSATAAANLILEGLFHKKGIFPPELIGKYESCFRFIMDYLADRGVVYRKIEQNI
ncbi:MAG: saccharopine dehydrogenase NADP-binding domain-containing protein [Bacteroidales bacterium]|nr:saccharopine dehydrogenase NADP-binding domain-containing protein [Bacteroidales bacterium]